MTKLENLKFRAFERRVYKKNIKFLDRVEKLKKQGVPEKDIAAEFGAPGTVELRRLIQLVSKNVHITDTRRCMGLYRKGYSIVKISKKVKRPYSTVVSLLKSQGVNI